MRRHFAVVLFFFALCPLVQAATAAQMDPDTGKPISAATEQKVRAFLDRFIDADKTPSEQVALFADTVEYYNHGIVGKMHILHDVERYVRHWPQRDFQLAQIIYISTDPESDRVFVAYTIDFEVANRTRALSGRASYGAVIGDLDTAPKVESIKERITERKHGAVPGE